MFFDPPAPRYNMLNENIRHVDLWFQAARNVDFSMPMYVGQIALEYWLILPLSRL